MKVIPKKSLGQHWLNNEAILHAICEAADVQPGDNVLEIGPGLGSLTKKLLSRGANVVAVEYDHALSASLTQNLVQDMSQVSSALQVLEDSPHVLEDSPHKSVLEDSPHKSHKLSGLDRLTVVEGDILRYDLQQLPEGYKVVANIPYYLTSKLIRVLCEAPNSFSRAALLIQREVAERVCAEQGDMSLLSVSTQFYCEVSLGIFVPKEFFVPPPKVDSQVLELRRRDQPLFQDVETKTFFRIARAGFSQKRKTLLNSLSAGLRLDKGSTETIIRRANIDPKSRAQTLSLEQWHDLYKAIDIH